MTANGYGCIINLGSIDYVNGRDSCLKLINYIDMAIHLVQIKNKVGRCVAVVKEPELLLLSFGSVYELAHRAIDSGMPIKKLINDGITGAKLDYNQVYEGLSDWKLLPCFDVPENPSLCLVAGTGLTHKNSALNRQTMHQNDDKPTDSMVMYQWGVAGGAPAIGTIGKQPEWFYKGSAVVLKGHGEQLTVPSYGNDGGEEPEVAGIYIISKKGQPYRVGFATGNEFSDHVMEKKNYLYLAPSKLRECSIGPELVITDDFDSFTGRVSVERKGAVLWESDIKSGAYNMAHSLANLEYHHFKYEAHRLPMQAHVHYFGADAFSFGNKISLEQGDVMAVQWNELGRTLKNFVNIASEKEELIEIKTLL
jgi:hypothetical protein